MDFETVIHTRRSIRKFRSDPIPEAKLAKLEEALIAAPSGQNLQPFRFIFVRDPEKRRQIVAQACHQDFLYEVPVLLVACCEKGKAFDTAIAVDHLVLAATNEGLGTCWIGWFEPDPVRRLLSVPETHEIPILVAIGTSGETPEVPVRKPRGALISIDAFG